MRKFIRAFLICCLSFCFIMAALHIIWVKTAPQRMQRNFIPRDVHTVVLGPSNGACSWIDELIPHSKNYCALARSMNGCYNTLKWIVEYNVHQIDTVILCASLPAFLYQHGDLGFSIYEEEVSLLDYADFFSYAKKSPDYWKSFFTSFPYAYFHQSSFDSGYFKVEWSKMNDPDLYRRVNEILDLVDSDKYGFTETVIRRECAAQVYYFEKIVSYCKQKEKILTILCPPVAKIPDLIDEKGYKSFILSELGDSSIIADYSRFALPDSTYYGDLMHLNHKGATVFSEDVAHNGLQYEYLVDYCNSNIIE